MLNFFRPWFFPSVLLFLFEWYVRRLGHPSDALATPSDALQALWKLFWTTGQDGLWQITGFTLLSAALGLALGALLGVGCGLMLGLLPRLSNMGFLTIEVLRPIPSVALIPLSMLVFGFGIRMEVCVVAFATFWPILILTQAAAQQIEPRLLEVCAALELPPYQKLMAVLLPAMVSRLFTALRLGIAIALVVAVTVEIAANPYGMGYAMMISQQSLDPASMLAWLIWIGVLGYGINVSALLLQQCIRTRMGEWVQDNSRKP